MRKQEVSVKDLSESELIKRSTSGDKDAYHIIVEKYQRRLFASAFEVLRNREDAEDVVQEALARSFFSLKNFRGSSSISTWLHRIVINLAIDLKRRVRRRGGEPIEYDEKVGIDENISKNLISDPEVLLEQKEQRKILMEVFDKLSEEHRQIFLLRESEGLSYEEIGRVLGVSTGTVMSRLFYARKKLQSELHDMRRD